MTHKLHDDAIVGIGIQDDNLVISIVLADNNQLKMKFISPISWSLSPFDVQNIILNFYEYDKESLDDRISVFFDVDAKDRALVLDDGYKMYCYTASVGMEGYIISKELRLEQI